MNVKTRLFALVIAFGAMGASAPGAASDCPGYADERLLDIVASLALIAEQVDASVDRELADLDLHAGVLRQMAIDADPAALRAACRMVQQFPSIEPALLDVAELLADPKMDRWLATAAESKFGTRDPALTLNCLTTEEYIGVRTSLFVLRITLNALQAVCDALSCTPDACVAFCAIAQPVVGIITPIFEAGLAVDALHCSTRHAKEMELWCDDAVGSCQTGREAGSTFVDARTMLDETLVPQIESLSANVASSDTLAETSQLLADRFGRTETQIDSLNDIVDSDIAGQEAFTDQIRRIDIEVQLAGSAQGVPVQLVLPRSAGGRLEEVRELVADSIVRTTAAGLDVFDALDFLRQGDAALNANDYAGAFDAYRQAYQEVVR